VWEGECDDGVGVGRVQGDVLRERPSYILSSVSLSLDRSGRLTDVLVEVTGVTRDPSEVEVCRLSDLARVDARREFSVPSRVVLLPCLPDLTARGRREGGRVVEEGDGGGGVVGARSCDVGHGES
jgi:hypothetical protein